MKKKEKTRPIFIKPTEKSNMPGNKINRCFIIITFFYNFKTTILS